MQEIIEWVLIDTHRAIGHNFSPSNKKTSTTFFPPLCLCLSLLTSTARARGAPLRLISRGLSSMNSIPGNFAICQLTIDQLRIIAILLDQFVMRTLFQEHTPI